MKIELSGHYTIRRLLLSSLPNVLMMIVSSIYSIVDGLFVSNWAGTTPFAALNIIWPGLMVVAALGLMIGTGGSALVSMTMGQGDKERADRLFSMLIRFAFLLGVVFAVPMFLFMRPIAIALGAEGELIKDAVIYGRILAAALPFFILQMAFQSFYMTAEKPRLGTILSIVCGLTNMVLDALFIVGFHWGIAGAAAATAMAQLVGGAWPLWYFTSKRNTSSLHLSKTGWDGKALLHACTNGLSEYVGNIALSIVGMCYNLQLMRYIGENGVAAYGIIMYIGFVFAAIFIGYNLTVAPVVGFNYGAQNHAELRSLLRKSLTLMSIAGLVMTAISEAASRPMSAIFVSYDADLMALTVRALRLYMLSFLLCGINMFTSAWFTALGNGVVSAIAAFTRTLVFELGAVFILPMVLGIDGIWMAVNVAEVLACILSISLLFAFRKRYHYT